jgi:predicted RNase H-like nuclease (RuvC/YqgF family)
VQQQGISTTTLMTAGTAAAGATMMAVKFMKAASSVGKGKGKGKGSHDRHDQDRQQEEQRQECKSAAVNCAASTRALNERADYLARQISALEEELQSLSNPSSPGNQTSSKIKGINSRIDDLEEKLESQEKLIKKLMSKLAAQ